LIFPLVIRNKSALSEAYLELYKDRINKRLNAADKAKTRLKLQVFEFDNTSMTEERVLNQL